MLNIQILTYNNQQTIQRTLESLQTLDAEVTVGDLGSRDETITICENMGAVVERLGEYDRASARNELSKPGMNLAVEPWEALVQGKGDGISTCSYVSILNKKVLTKEVRLWNYGIRHRNHTFETPECTTDTESDIILYSIGQRDHSLDRRLINMWKQKKPTAAEPFYFQACIELAEGKYEEFIRNAQHYLFLDKSNVIATIMTRYYLAYAYLYHRGEAKPALQNLNLCLCAQPLMAEFWCLMGDVYYHLLRKFAEAMEFYENAIILGGRRLKTDHWPMDISKYREYPMKMIASCESLQKKFAIYASRSMKSVIV